MRDAILSSDRRRPACRRRLLWRGKSCVGGWEDTSSQEKSKRLSGLQGYYFELGSRHNLHGQKLNWRDDGYKEASTAIRAWRMNGVS